jgi:DNA replication and repair protein RecF
VNQESENFTITRTVIDTASQSILSLQLQNFRNYEALRVVVEPGQPVVLMGSNGAGKTNILEAISLLTPGRGLRKAKFASMVRQDALPAARNWIISAEVSYHTDSVMLGTSYEAIPGAQDKRVVKVQGESVRAQADLAHYFSALWLTPQMDQLFNEAKSERRKFLDRLVYTFDASHATRVNGFEHAMRERNRLLSGRYADPAWLTVLEEKIAAQSVAIAVARLQAVERLNAVIRDGEEAFTRPLLELAGDAEARLLEGASALDVEQEMAAQLAAQRPEDVRMGRTRTGAHRSTLLVWHQTHQREAEFCSTGEQKAMLMSIVLGHARARASWYGSAPVLLLDEVVSHLDRTRRQHLFEFIRHLRIQAWMSGTDAVDFSPLAGEALQFRVEENRIVAL